MFFKQLFVYFRKFISLWLIMGLFGLLLKFSLQCFILMNAMVFERWSNHSPIYSFIALLFRFRRHYIFQFDWRLSWVTVLWLFLWWASHGLLLSYQKCFLVLPRNLQKWTYSVLVEHMRYLKLYKTFKVYNMKNLF